LHDKHPKTDKDKYTRIPVERNLVNKHALKFKAVVVKWHIVNFEFCPSVKFIKTTVFWKLGPFLFPDEEGMENKLALFNFWVELLPDHGAPTQ
jgi:hypothetical protein